MSEPPSWAERQAAIDDIAREQLFFVGGAPRSGTTWLQQILDAHPDISCQGEGLFQKYLGAPLVAMMGSWRTALEDKNNNLFRHTGGYPLPSDDDAALLLGSAILQALHRQSAGKSCRAIGEKTPENVFFNAQLKSLFPGAKFITIARDPRDVLTSAWHFFRKPAPGVDHTEAKTAFIRSAIPALAHGARATLAFAAAHPQENLLVTYEQLSAETAATVGRLYAFLGVAADAALVADCIGRTAFAAMTGGRDRGDERSGAFHRKGVVGDWRATLTPEMSVLILRELGWMYGPFGLPMD
jgi:hypothetical protein